MKTSKKSEKITKHQLELEDLRKHGLIKPSGPAPQPSGINPADPDIAAKITQIHEEVRKQTKSKKPQVPEEKPRYKERPKSTDSTEKRKRRKKAKGQPVIEGPTITIKELAYDYGMNPKELRRLLRKSDIEKPSGRWEWPKDSKTVKKIKKLIKRSGKSKVTTTE